MKRTDLTPLAHAVRLALLVLSAALSSCGQQTLDPTGGETHFLRACSLDRPCGGQLQCINAVCTLPCIENATCAVLPGAACLAEGAGSAAAGRCEAQCEQDGDCSAVGPSLVCADGLCRPDGFTVPTADATIPNEAGSSSVDSSVAVPDAGMPDAASDAQADAGPPALTCSGEVIAPDELLFIGDSFFATNPPLVDYVETLAREEALLGADEHYRNAARLAVNSLALGGAGLRDQYVQAAGVAPVRVVVMNGGGADVLVGSCPTPDQSCALLQAAASGAADVLSEMAQGGVLDVVYAFYPNPVDDALQAKMDALRPLVESACNASTLRCHWLDLRAAFEGRYDTLVQSDGNNPTAAGSEVAAGAIWQTMRGACTP